MRVERVGDFIEGEIVIQAAPAVIFTALTDPAEVKAWWSEPSFYRTLDAGMDLRPGGEWFNNGENPETKNRFGVRGKVVTVDPPRALSYTWNPTWGERMPETTVEWLLTEQDGGTLLSLRHGSFAGQPEMQEGHTEGWIRVVGLIKGYAEAR